MITVRRCNESDYDRLIAFNEQVFPERNIEAKVLMDYRFKKREKSGYEECVIVTDEKEILGQVLFTSTYATYKGVDYNGTFYMDTMVRADQRKYGYGLSLMSESIKTDRQQWSAGSTEFQIKRRLKLGMRIIGFRKLYVKLNNPLLLFVKAGSFPKNIASFFLLSKEEIMDLPDTFNRELFEFGRNKDFIQWRFFEAPHVYYLYKSENNNDYFVVRIIKKEGISMLCLCDYRCNFTEKDDFSNIIQVVKRLAQRVNIPFTITSSSLKASDEVLKKNGFIGIADNNVTYLFNYIRKKLFNKRPKGKDAVVFAYNMDEIIDQERIDMRGYTLITLADSDGELLW
ncbi:MAG: GNAT family N-acetyltransferase [Tannerellaceae bacterium]|jgi:hypothetical protein|nr:GNAT family N-acetyltransferase [Tannerellaceae bacterium]